MDGTRDIFMALLVYWFPASFQVNHRGTELKIEFPVCECGTKLEESDLI